MMPLPLGMRMNRNRARPPLDIVQLFLGWCLERFHAQAEVKAVAFGILLVYSLRHALAPCQLATASHATLMAQYYEWLGHWGGFW